MIQSIVNEKVICLQNVGVRYRRRTGFMRSRDMWAVKDVTFDIYHGETLGVIGQNGAGKSTLLKVIANIIEPDAGQVIRESDYRASLLALQVGFIPYLTGRENALMSGMFLGMSREQIISNLEKIISFSELQDFIDFPVHTYSVGMKSRLGFAIALQADPDVILIDEILGVGDALFKKKSSSAMKEKIKSNKTVVLVSHNNETLRDLCDRLVWIDHGKSVLIGKTEDVLREYEQKMGNKAGKSRKAS